MCANIKFKFTSWSSRSTSLVEEEKLRIQSLVFRRIYGALSIRPSKNSRVFFQIANQFKLITRITNLVVHIFNCWNSLAVHIKSATITATVIIIIIIITTTTTTSVFNWNCPGNKITFFVTLPVNAILTFNKLTQVHENQVIFWPQDIFGWSRECGRWTPTDCVKRFLSAYLQINFSFKIIYLGSYMLTKMQFPILETAHEIFNLHYLYLVRHGNLLHALNVHHRRGFWNLKI